MTREDIERWLAAYEHAWRAPGTEPRMWDAERPDGEQFDVSHEIVAVEGDTAVGRAHVRYRKPRAQESAPTSKRPFFPDRPRIA